MCAENHNRERERERERDYENIKVIRNFLLYSTPTRIQNSNNRRTLQRTCSNEPRRRMLKAFRSILIPEIREKSKKRPNTLERLSVKNQEFPRAPGKQSYPSKRNAFARLKRRANVRELRKSSLLERATSLSRKQTYHDAPRSPLVVTFSPFSLSLTS